MTPANAYFARQELTMRRYTIAGLVAILLWSTSVALSRELTEALGTLTAATAVYLVAGLLSCVYAWRSPGGWAVAQLPRSYLFGCGALFVLYITMLYLAIGAAQDRAQVITVGLINYLWPALSLVFSIPMLHKRAKPSLIIGLVMALAGIWLAAQSGQAFSLQDVAGNSGGLVPYGCALVAAICWGIYSNLTRRWGGQTDIGGVPLFLLASGIALLLLRLPIQETGVWSLHALSLLLFMALGPAMLAYLLWDASMRKGDMILVASLSNATPLLSSLISMVVLRVTPGLFFWLAVLMVMLGAVICRSAIVDRAKT
jgi:drug/metabolite transporter (DMT)-like permease